MCPQGSFLSLPFNLAFEQHHKSNIKHLYYVADDKENKAIGYAQEFNIQGDKICDYQRKNMERRSLINLILKLLNLKVVALGNGLLTNISNFSSFKLSNNIDFFNSLLLLIQPKLCWLFLDFIKIHQEIFFVYCSFDNLQSSRREEYCPQFPCFQPTASTLR